MSTNVTLVTLYQVMSYPTTQFFEKESEALKAWKRGRRSDRRCSPKQREAIKFPDGTIRILSENIIILGIKE